MATKKTKSKKPRPRDMNQLAKEIVDIATGQKKDTVTATKKNAKRFPVKVSGRPPESMYAVFKKCASIAFNYPSIKLCSDGDIITYLKNLKP